MTKRQDTPEGTRVRRGGRATSQPLVAPRAGAPDDALACAPAMAAQAHGHQPITSERAGALVDQLFRTDDENEQATTLIVLLGGLAAAHFDAADTTGDAFFESLIFTASHRAYQRTTHFDQSFAHFVARSV